MNEPAKQLVFSQAEIQTKVRELAARISLDYQGKDLILIGVLKGAFVFMADLIRALTVPAAVDFVRLASYGCQTQSSGDIVMTKDVEADLTGRAVLIVEDIADSGLSMKWLKRHLLERGAESVRICVLIDKLERRDERIGLDYAGFEVDAGFLVGYGLDYQERYRHLPDIYHLQVA
jgi:hypoxanthine phosphoribosyltransferase